MSGGANNSVGDGAASCELKAPFVPPDTTTFMANDRSRPAIMMLALPAFLDAVCVVENAKHQLIFGDRFH
jgi:hypothetical protein